VDVRLGKVSDEFTAVVYVQFPICVLRVPPRHADVYVQLERLFVYCQPIDEKLRNIRFAKAKAKCLGGDSG
jgi:hypothetical protein